MAILSILCCGVWDNQTPVSSILYLLGCNDRMVKVKQISCYSY